MTEITTLGKKGIYLVCLTKYQYLGNYQKTTDLVLV